MSRVVVQACLLSGRYHAHPWGEAQHAMAGPEWPPSPWRLLRGLAAAWFNANPPLGSETERDDLLQALGRASPPALWLSTVSFAEIPYYQPIEETKGRVLHFDHFAVLSEGAEGACFCFDFDVNLSARQQHILKLLLARMTYFGRAESRAHLSIVEALPSNLTKVTPAVSRASSGETRRRVLVTRSTFRARDLWSSGSREGHLVQATIDEGRKRPPNTEWIDYGVPSALVRPQLDRHPTMVSAASPQVVAVRFGLFRRVPIRLQELVRVARNIRNQATSNFEMETGTASRRLTGRETDGSIARGHQHAFWLPEPDPGAAQIRKCTVWLPDGSGGIDQRELDALLSVRRIFPDDDYPILVVAERITETLPEPKLSRRWRSLTPFLSPWHSHRGQPELEPSEQLRRMVEEITSASPNVTAISGSGPWGSLTTVCTHRYQNDTWHWARRVAAWFKLEFDYPVTLPRPLGVDAHFGLGQFVPVDDQEEE